ncbi:MAG: prephenate dehydrogenase [Oscillospiraceae bacterium]|nr:prephenate dehydrogenase [Oscillospiraceae bacterium]
MKQLNIAVVGLGLIGGSFCKAIAEKTDHHCWGYDLSQEACRMAVEAGAVEGILDVSGSFDGFDLLLVCLHPKQTISFILEHADQLSSSTLVADSCGVKKMIVDEVEPALRRRGIPFIGAHPMAGREFSGFAYAIPTLYEGASFIMTPPEDADPAHLALLEELARELGFGRIVRTTPEKHDATIAFTSQIAHVLSNAYVKSPTLQNQSGFSAGSFQDLSRVARLNEYMWTDLFLMNRPALLCELETLIGHLQEYADALQAEDADTLRALLKDGREKKEWSDRQSRR